MSNAAIHAAMSTPKYSVRPESHRALLPTPDKFPAWLWARLPRVASERLNAELTGNVRGRLERSHSLLKPFLIVYQPSRKKTTDPNLSAAWLCLPWRRKLFVGQACFPGGPWRSTVRRQGST